jgi:hypothetical protein
VELAASRISLLVAWRRGGTVAALSSGGLLAFGWLGTVGPLTGLGIAMCIMAGAEIALHRFVRRCALCPELSDIPAVARSRSRLCSARRPRAFGASLRQTALASPRERENVFVQWDRVALVRDELLALADELESADNVDPRTMVELDRLLCDGRDSPLLNEQLPASELVSTVRCVRFRVLTARPRCATGESAVATPAAATPADGDCGRRRRGLVRVHSRRTPRARIRRR